MDGDNEMNTVEDAQMSSEVFTPPDGCWVPNTQGYISGSARELEQKLKLAGIKLRRELLLNAHNDIEAWSLLYSPPSIHQASKARVQASARDLSQSKCQESCTQHSAFHSAKHHRLH